MVAIAGKMVGPQGVDGDEHYIALSALLRTSTGGALGAQQHEQRERRVHRLFKTAAFHTIISPRPVRTTVQPDIIPGCF
jgi:hypothetical protein